MIPQQKVVFLEHLVLSAKETVMMIEQALQLGDEAKVEELKGTMKKLNDEIKRNVLGLV